MHTLAQNPVDYGTWATFKHDFDKQFIPPQTQLEAITKMHGTNQGSWEFGKWYQEWSQYTRCAGTDEITKMYAFYQALNSAFQGKILLLSPQPDTLAGLVEKAREFDCNWRMYAKPNTQTCRNPHVQELLGEETNSNAEINVFHRGGQGGCRTRRGCRQGFP